MVDGISTPQYWYLYDWKLEKVGNEAWHWQAAHGNWRLDAWDTPQDKWGHMPLGTHPHLFYFSYHPNGWNSREGSFGYYPLDPSVPRIVYKFDITQEGVLDVVNEALERIHQGEFFFDKHPDEMYSGELGSDAGGSSHPDIDDGPGGEGQEGSPSTDPDPDPAPHDPKPGDDTLSPGENGAGSDPKEGEEEEEPGGVQPVANSLYIEYEVGEDGELTIAGPYRGFPMVMWLTGPASAAVTSVAASQATRMMQNGKIDIEPDL